MNLIGKALLRARRKLGYKFYVLTAILAYTVAFSIAEIALYQSFKIYSWDLGIFNQSLWNTLHGRLLYYTAETGIYTTTGSLLGTHFMPIVLLAIPLYAIFPTCETLLIVSTAVVALGAIAVFGIAKELLKSEKAAAVLAISYLFYPPLQGVTLSGFSAEAFAVTIFLFIVYYLLKPNIKRLVLAVALGLFTHEAAIPIIAFIGIYGMIYHRSVKKTGFQASLAILLTSIPFYYFAQTMRIAFGWNQNASLWHEWAIMGANGISDIPSRILLNPAGTFASLTFDLPAKLAFVLILLVPVLFIPILGLRGIIPAIPFLFVGLLSSYRIYYTIEGHYTAFVVPFLFLGLIHGLARMGSNQHLRVSPSKITKSVFLVSLISLAVIFPLIYSQYQSFVVDHDHIDLVNRYLQRIPMDSSVLTQNDIFPRVSGRFNAYTLAPPSWGDDYRRADELVLKNLSGMSIQWILIDFASSDRSAASVANLIYTEFIQPNNAKYELVSANGGVLLFALRT